MSIAAADGFIGREPEVGRIGRLLLSSAGLITLLGSGGIGKTRLAAEAVRGYHKATHVPVYWARLARLVKDSDRAAVEKEVARAVLDADFSSRSVFDALVDTLTVADAAGRNRQVILVLDNCEHVVGGVGELIAELLDAVPSLSVVATSREAIHLTNEQLVEVPPLTNMQAVTLFRQRAELTDHTIAEPEQITIVEQICRHLDCHPLYIRLAAARLARRPLAGILDDLSGRADDKRMRWPGPRVGAEARHKAVGDAIAWSYDLCDDQERLLLDRMSVFAAGYDPNPQDDRGERTLDVGADLDAIVKVCADESDAGGHVLYIEHSGSCAVVSLTADEVEGVLQRLVDQSLVSVHITTTNVRYSLLESIRVFAQQRLHERSIGEVDASARLAARHRRYYRDKVVFAAANWFGPCGQDLMDWARAEWDNLLSAIETSITTPDEAVLGLEMCCALTTLRTSFYKGSVRETRHWTECTLAATRASFPQPTELQTGALAQLVYITLLQGQREDAEKILDDCVAICLPDHKTRTNWRQSPEIDINLPASVEFAWGAELFFGRSDPRAVTVLTRAHDKAHRLGNDGAAVTCEMFAAGAAALLGTSQQALDLARRHLDHASASGASLVESWAEMVWAIALVKHGDPSEALTFTRTALAQQLAAGDQWGALWAVEIRVWSLAQIIVSETVAATIAAADSDPLTLTALATEAAQLAGGVKVLRARLGVEVMGMGPVASEYAEAVGLVRQVLGDDAFTVAETQGSRLRPELAEVHRFALGTLSIE